MSFAAFLTLLLIGLFGSFVSGMVGIGGSIVKYPLLLYVPTLLGVSSFTAHQVSGISAVQVLFATALGVWAYRKGNYLHYQLIAVMGAAIILGSFVGALVAESFEESTINLVYAALASIAAVMMFVPKPSAQAPSSEVRFNAALAAGLAGGVGFFSGIVGAAGAFLLVPIMLVILRIPTRVTVASSLAITFISSIGTTAGKLWAGDVLIGPALIMIWASLLGAPLGAYLGKRLNVKWIQAILAMLILATCIKIWMEVFVS
ncbi:MAG: sulfite exporter TauE/SafE family protein [Alicyclobacillus sp.]|nr:sulfite exporter TauE/SafE family protein [Alicyclobacillus sp.]